MPRKPKSVNVNDSVLLLQGNVLDVIQSLSPKSVQMIVTSPPYYGLRDYGVDGQIGLEETPEAYVDKLVRVFREVRRVLKDDGTLWLNLGDSYWGGKGRSGYELPDEAETRRANGETLQTAHNVPGYMDMRPTDGKHPVIKAKDLVGIPWMVAFALRADGWYLRSEIIWHKPNPMPESVKDRPTKAHEQIFLLSKSAQYFYDADAVREPQDPKSLERLKRGWNGNGDRGYPNGPQNHLKNYMGKSDEEIAALPGRNRRTVWTVTTKPYKEAHFATFPPDLIEPCILAGSRVGDTVLDPFNGSGTTCMVAQWHTRKSIGIDLNPAYIKLAQRRINENKTKTLRNRK